MATLSAKKVLEALKQARNIGQVEEEATIVGCKIVLQSLRPDEYETIALETGEKEDLAFLNAYRMEHLCRSIVEINGTSFRDYATVEVEVEEEDPKTGRITHNVVNIERHAFMRDHVLNTWSREALDTAFKKFNDVIAKAEQVASHGVTFTVPDETPDEKYRRLLAELKEVEGSVPMDLASRLLEDNGYMKRSSTAEVQKVDEGLRRLAAEQEVRAARELPVEAVPTPVQVAPAPESAVRRPPSPEIRPEMIPEQVLPTLGATSRPATPEDMMRARQPLNRGEVPASVPLPPQGGAEPMAPARPRSVPPPNATNLSSRYADIEALDGQIGEGPVTVAQTRIDPKQVAAALDPAPRGGVNPRFRPPPR